MLSNLFQLLHGYNECLDNKLDASFNNIIDEPLTAQILIELFNHNQPLTKYVVDSLKRYHSLNDVNEMLAKCMDLKKQLVNKNLVDLFEDIIDTITTRLLLTTTIESVSSESQRFLANFIKKNDLPIPFTYYVWNQKNAIPSYKINFNCLMEVLCLSDSCLCLQFGSDKCLGFGKTSLLSFVFDGKRTESLFTEGNAKYRASCIDVLFGNTKNNSYAIFDVHGTVNENNSLLVQAIQAYAALQIVYVTEKDLRDPSNKSNDDFLTSLMQYSSCSSNMSTIVVIFDTNFENAEKTQQIINHFQDYYSDRKWPNVYWLSSPILSTLKDLSKLKRKRCVTQLRNQFSKIMGDIESKICTQNLMFRSCFSIQELYLTIKQQDSNQIQTKVERQLAKFEIENKLEELFQSITDQTENLKIITPISYYRSEIETIKKKKLYDIMNDLCRIEYLNETLKQLEREHDSQNGFTKYSQLIIDLFNNRTYIDMLITEHYFEKWRLRYVPRIKQELDRIKSEKAAHQKKLTEQEKLIKVEDGSNKKADKKALDDFKKLREEDEKLNLQLQSIDKKLANVDLTIGLLCDELFALYDYLHDKRPTTLDQYQTEFIRAAKNIANLVNKGFALHILRSRPLTCKSNLMKMVLDNLHVKENSSIVILTVIGEQSSAKSSLLNSMFGCNFRVSAGRCTIGMYLGIVYHKNLTIAILDTEGLMSLEESGSIFDNQIVTMAVLTSHLVLVNHKGELNSTLEGLMGMSLYAKSQIGLASFKPKLFFILRDQTSHNTAMDTFQAQLNKFKDNLQNSSKFLKVSLDDELEIKQENVVLLPSAFSEDMNEDLNILQRWRNQIFAYKINELRENTFNELEQCCRNESFALKTIDTLYNKLSGNWKTIDDLGLGLLECKSLAELKLINELKSIANNIIEKYSTVLLEDGRKLLDGLLAHEKQRTQELLRDEMTNSCLNSDKDVKKFIEDGFEKLDNLTHKLVQDANDEYENSTQQNYYSSLKSNIQKNIEHSIRCTQYLLKQRFDQDAYEISKQKAALQVQKRLLNIAKNHFNKQTQTTADIDRLNAELDAEYAKLYQEFENNLNLLKKSKDDITETILNIYNGLIKSRGTTTGEYDIYKFCTIRDSTTYRDECNSLDFIFLSITSYLAHRKQLSNAGKIYDFFSGNSWGKWREALAWFKNLHADKHNQKIFLSIAENVIPQLNRDINTMLSTIKLAYNDPQLITDLIQYVDNAMKSQNSSIQQNWSELNIPRITKDLIIIAFRLLIEQALQITDRKHEELKKKLDELKEWKENIKQQFLVIKNSFEQGQKFKNDLSKQIVQEVIGSYTKVIIRDIHAKITNNTDINPDKIAVNAYNDSIGSNPPNANSIMKYIIDINRYYLEIALNKVRISQETIVTSQIHLLQDIIYRCVDKALETVKNHCCDDVYQVYQDIVKNLKTIVQDFQLSPLIGISADIKEPDQFKKSFAQLLLSRENMYNDVCQNKSQFETAAKKAVIDLVRTRLGCQARCPGCGSKCDNTDVGHTKHYSTRHLAGVFFGWRVHGTNEPYLSLCYQHWENVSLYSGEEKFHPKRSYYLQRQPDWFDDLETKAKTGEYRKDSIPPTEQRHAWMAVREAVVKYYASNGMKDFEEYDHNLYPKIASIDADYVLKWDEDV